MLLFKSVSAALLTHCFCYNSCHFNLNVHRATDSQGANESHEDLTSVLYNNTFNQVVMVKSLGLVKIYQAEVSLLLVCLLLSFVLTVYHHSEKMCSVFVSIL